MIVQHLLPNAKAWRITAEKNLRKFFIGLSGIESDVKSFFDLAYLDIFPQTTREIEAWESQFGLLDYGLTTQQKRDRLDAKWKEFGGQSPKYIQDILRSNGFDVYVHEWWIPGTEPSIGVHTCATPKNPFLYINIGKISGVECGEAESACGEAFAECGNTLQAPGYLLVNKILQTSANYLVLCGESISECGELESQCGNFDGFRDDQVKYTIPIDQLYWPYFLYIGGNIFGTLATIPATRRDEFEALCLKIKPLQQWLGIIVQYS